MKLNYYSLNDILKIGAQYNRILGQRSNGKTYAVLKYMLQQYADTGKAGAYIRRFDEEITPTTLDRLFQPLIANDEIEKIFKNKGDWTGIKYYRRKFYLTKLDDKEKVIVCETPIRYTFALNLEQEYKGTRYPDITTIFFDEFITRKYYLTDEFILFENIISTIKGTRQDVKIFRCANTINKYCIYFKEMGLRHAPDIEEGKIEVYSYGESTLKVAVQRAENVRKIHSKKDIDPFFAFDNPKLKMITSGEWELDLYPHAPFHWLPKEIQFTYFIIFDEKTYQCEIIHHEKEWITYIHEKTTPIKKFNDIVFQNITDTNPYHFPNILRPVNPTCKAIAWFYATKKVFYQDNEVGDAINNYLVECSMMGYNK